MRKQFTNEELVKFIQEGHEIYLELLWTQVERFVAMKANERLMKEPPNIRDFYFEDVYHCGYFALQDAVKAYNPEKGAGFLTYLELQLRSKFNEALGVRTEKGKKDPIRNAQSLDEPLPGKEEYSLLEVIIDPNSEGEYDRIVEEALKADINSFISAAIRQLPTEEHKVFFLTLINCNYNQALTAKKLGINYPKARKIYLNGLRTMRFFMNARKTTIQAIGIDEFIGIEAYRGGLQRFKNKIFTSCTEIAACNLLEFNKQRSESNTIKTGFIDDVCLSG